jgi:hypothetical protein
LPLKAAHGVAKNQLALIEWEHFLDSFRQPPLQRIRCRAYYRNNSQPAGRRSVGGREMLAG